MSRPPGGDLAGNRIAAEPSAPTLARRSTSEILQKNVRPLAVLAQAAFLLLLLVLPAVAAEHPHLLFTKAELPAIRQRAESGVPAKAWAEIRASADKQLTVEPIVPARFQCPLVMLGLAWQISGDEQYADKLRTTIARLRQESETVPFDYGGLYDGKTFDWPIVYDLAYDVLDEPTRTWIREGLGAQAAAAHAELVAGWGQQPGLHNSNLMIPGFCRAARTGACLAGEPGYDPAWLDLAAANFRRYFRECLGPDGDAAEHAVYWFFGMSLRGNLTAWMLHRKGHDLVTGTNLPQWPAWLLYESIPPQPRCMNLGDAGVQEWSPANVYLNGALLPDNPAMDMLLARHGGAVGRSTEDLVLALLAAREPPVRDPAAVLPERARLFARHGRVLLRSDWGKDAFAASFHARWTWGHAHDDIGSFTLWSHGRYWAIDSGYGHRAGEAHNMILVDGRGMPDRAGPGDVDQFLASPMAAVATIDATRAWNTQYSGHFDWAGLFPVPGVAIAERRFVTIWEDPDLGIPRFVVVDDTIQQDGAEHDYDWLLGTSPDHAIEVHEQAAQLTDPDNDRWVQAPAGQMTRQDSAKHWLTHTMTVPAAGDYELWAYCRGADTDWGGAYVNAAIDKQMVGYLALYGSGWSWRKLSRRTVALEPGPVAVRLDQNQQHGTVQPTRFRALALTTATAPELLARTPAPADGLVVSPLDETTELVGDWHWVERQGPAPLLDVAVVRPEVTLRTDWYDQTHRFRERHPRLRALAHGVAAHFTVLLYPRTTADPDLPLKTWPGRYGYPYQLEWPTATDYFGSAEDQKSSGKGFTYGAQASFWLVRVPRTEATPPLGKYAHQLKELPPTLSYLAVAATDLHFEGTQLLDVTDVAGGSSSRNFGQAATVACRGDRLEALVFTTRAAAWQIARDVRVRAWAPQVRQVIANGTPTEFERDGDFVVFTIRSIVFDDARAAVAARMQEAYDNR